MEFLLGPSLANIFVGFHEKGLLSCPNKQIFYFRYVEKMFCPFKIMRLKWMFLKLP